MVAIEAADCQMTVHLSHLQAYGSRTWRFIRQKKFLAVSLLTKFGKISEITEHQFVTIKRQWGFTFNFLQLYFQ